MFFAARRASGDRVNSTAGVCAHARSRMVLVLLLPLLLSPLLVFGRAVFAPARHELSVRLKAGFNGILAMERTLGIDVAENSLR